MRASIAPSNEAPNISANPKSPRRTPHSSYKRRLICRHDAAAPRHEIANLPALRVRKRRDVRQDQNLIMRRVLRIQQPVMDHLKRNPRLDQRLIVAQRVVLHLRPRLRAAIELRRLLRINHRHARQRRLVAQIPFVAEMPPVQILHHRQPALVMQRARELREPRPRSLRDPVDRPQPHLRPALHRVLPAIRLLHPHAEDPADRLPPHRRAVLLAVLPVSPHRRQPAARLAVGEQNRRQLADRLHVQIGQRAAAGVGDVASRRIDLANLRVPQPPQFE